MTKMISISRRLFSPLPIILACCLLLAVLISGAHLDASAQPAPQPEGTVWGVNVRANSDYGPDQYSQHEPSLAISRTDPNIVVAVAKDYRIGNDKQVWIYVSQDGGQTWPENLQLQIPGLPADIPNQSDPVAFARDDGRIYVMALGHNDNHGIFLTWTDDNGLTWKDPSVHVAYNDTPCCLDDKEWPAVDNTPTSPYYHNMYAAWANGGILFKRSTDGGETWSSYVNLTPYGDTEYPYPVVASDGDLYVFYMDGWGYCADGTIRYRKSEDGGVTFGSPVAVASTSQPCSPIHGGGGYDQFRFFSIIAAAANPTNPDDLYVAWTDDNGIYNGKVDVLYVHSTDGGSTWSTPARLSHDDPAAYVDHITPVFAFNETGRLHAFWLDRRDDPENVLWNGYHTSTLDGITWEADNRVSTQAFDLNLYFPPPPGYNAAGDYWGLDVVGNIVMAAWNTTVETSQDIYVARGVYTYPVTLTGSVVDALNLAPIPDAQVMVDTGVYTSTNPSGIYVLPLDAGVYTVTAQSLGYVSQTITDVELITGTVELNFALQPQVALTGIVSDALTALPIPGAQITLDTGVFTDTNPSGLYAFLLDPGTYTVTATADGYYAQTISNVELISGTVELNFALQPFPPVLEGLVSDADTSLPLAGAQVSLDSGDFAFTGPDGRYSLTLEPGVYTVTAQTSGYYSQTVSGIELVEGTVTQDFALQPIPQPVTATLTGLVSDALYGIPIAGAEIQVDSGALTTTTQADGVYTITLLAGVYTVTAQAQGYFSQTVTDVELVSGTYVLDFVLQPLLCPLPEVSGVVVTLDGLTATFTPSITSTLSVTYLWDFGDGITSTLEAPVHVFTDFGTYTVTLQVTNVCGSAAWEGQVSLKRSYFIPVLYKAGP